ncbi:unnamed protein product [Thelazia callipaeda]|uniref:Uncharacterized protein n=1 Tax=Thelazia callipaeda TaxID=103827 RepID=A0A0N5D0E0_THECL|nr:unnamed protein product [Thelazia callipaeda]
MIAFSVEKRDRSGWSGNSLSDDFTGQRYQSGGRSRYQPSSASEYGGGALGNSFGMVQSAKQSGIETLLNTFLGPAFLGQTTQPPAINLANFFKPNYHKNEDYLATGASNIDRLINVLTKSGAQRATPSPSQNLLQNLFGKR